MFFPPKSPLQHFCNARTAVGFRGLLGDGITIKSHACKSGSATMKRFVTIVLRGLISLSKENPIWAKEHHRPPKKEIRRKRRAVKRAKNMGRRNLVRAVRISYIVNELGYWSIFRLCCLWKGIHMIWLFLPICGYIWQYSVLAFFQLDTYLHLILCDWLIVHADWLTFFFIRALKDIWRKYVRIFDMQK